MRSKSSLQSIEMPCWPYASTVYVVTGKIVHGHELYDHMAKTYKVKVPKLCKADSSWAGACFFVKNSPDVVIWIAEPDLTGAYDVIAHEVFHAVRKIMRNAAVKRLTKDNEESWAYLMGALVGAIVDWTEGRYD